MPKLVAVLVSKADYPGRHVSHPAQRAAISGAMIAPQPVGGILAAREAAKFAPPRQQHHAAAREIAASAAGITGGVLGFKHGGRLAEKSKLAEKGARKIYSVAQRGNAHLSPRLQRATHIKPEGSHLEPKWLGRAVGAKVGGTALGIPASQMAISHGFKAQDKYNATHKVRKAASNSGLTQHQARGLVRRKRASAVLNVAGGTAGLTALALAGAKRPAMLAHRERAIVAGAGIGGVAAFNSAAISHREATAERKQLSKHDCVHLRYGRHTACGKHVKDVGHTSVDATQVECQACRSAAGVSKAQQPIQTTMRDDQAHKLVHGKGGYGLAGPLPKHLDRETRKSAYEARYVASGGHKKQRWQHTADNGDRVRNAGIVGATIGGALSVAAESPRARKLVAPLKSLKRFESSKLTHHELKHKAERAAVASATAGGLGELTEEGAKRRRASYSSAAGGVAASNLRRMQNYTP